MYVFGIIISQKTLFKGPFAQTNEGNEKFLAILKIKFNAYTVGTLKWIGRPV